jgi:acyl carrier protein
MTDTPPAFVKKQPEDIRSWLVNRVAYYLQLEPEEIDPDASLADYGLDSVYAFTLCGDIEDVLAMPIEPTLIWDVDSLTALTEHIVDLMARQPSP